MNFYDYFHNKINNILQELLHKNNVQITKELFFAVETPKNEAHGDVSTNVAMVYCKSFNMSPLVLAEIFKEEISKIKEIKLVEVVKPGFINMIIAEEFWQSAYKDVLKAGKTYAKNSASNKENINLEFVSANPTGPMHIGHGRGAVVGDVLASVYSYLGHKLTKEYYVNDAGNQVEVLGKSLYFRYMEALGKNIKQEDEFYPGDYLVKVAKDLVKQDGEKWVNTKEEEYLPHMKAYAISAMLKLIKEDLSLININHDIFSSEKEIANDEEYKKTLKVLSDKGLIYLGTLTPPKGKVIEDFEPREQKLFKSTLFGDDTDRPLEKSSGERTYFANDVVYHHNKINRGFSKLINIWGADHIGYIKRVESAVDALSLGKVKLLVVCCQLINLLDNGTPVRMSKRAGNFVTLKDLVDDVGADIFRFMMITRKNEVTLDFDLAKVKEQTSDNPLYYIQYAYARVCSVIKNAKQEFPNIDDEKIKNADLSYLLDPQEILLMKSVLKLPKSLENTLEHNDPHRLYLFLLDVSQGFHGLWNKGKESENLRFVVKNNENLTIARLALLQGVANVIAIVTQILGVNIKENM